MQARAARVRLSAGSLRGYTRSLENLSTEKINEFDELAKEATTFNGTMQALLEHPPIIVELQTEY